MSRSLEPRVVKAGNTGPFTLDGTRTFLVGHRQVAVIDPGPDVEEHIRALSTALGEAGDVRILLTHGHSDHAGAAASLASALDAPVLASPWLKRRSFIPHEVLPLEDGDCVPTDQGPLGVVEVPGHSRDHLAFHWLPARAVFVGDLLLGRGDTTWLGEYPGCVSDYLRSLRRIRDLAPHVLYPAHGRPLLDPEAGLELFEEHRMERIEEVRLARLDHPEADPGELARTIYGAEIPSKLQEAARASVEVTLFHLDQEARREGSPG